MRLQGASLKQATVDPRRGNGFAAGSLFGGAGGGRFKSDDYRPTPNQRPRM